MSVGYFGSKLHHGIAGLCFDSLIDRFSYATFPRLTGTAYGFFGVPARDVYRTSPVLPKRLCGWLREGVTPS